MPKITWQQGDKFLVRDDTGKVRKVERDRKGIKRGDYLQPIGKERDAFLKKYKYLPDRPKEETNAFLAKKGLLK